MKKQLATSDEPVLPGAINIPGYYQTLLTRRPADGGPFCLS